MIETTTGHRARIVPRVSVGMPVHNGEGLIRRALDSLLAQEFTDFELIISDNASTDSTAAICRELVAQDSRIRYYRQEVNRGPTANFSFVLQQARGTFFMWASHDDFWHREFIRHLVRALDGDESAGVAMGAVQRVHEDSTPRDVIRFPHSNIDAGGIASRAQVFRSMQYGSPYYMFIYGIFRRQLLLAAAKTGMIEVPGADHFFMAQIALATRFRYVDEILYFRTTYARTNAERHAGGGEGHRPAALMGWDSAQRAPLLTRLIWKSAIIPIHCKVYAAVWMAFNRLEASVPWLCRPIRWFYGLGTRTIRLVRGRVDDEGVAVAD